MDDDDEPIEVPQYHQTSNLFSSKRQNTTFKSSTTQNAQSKVSMISSLRGLPAPVRGRPPASDTSTSDAETIVLSKAPLSNGAVPSKTHSNPQVRPSPPVATRTTRASPPIAITNRFAGARRGVIQSRGQDEDDTWNRIRMQQLEAEADMFRAERLLERCWEVWKQAYRWIVVGSCLANIVRS